MLQVKSGRKICAPKKSQETRDMVKIGKTVEQREYEEICSTKLTERVLMFVVCCLLFVILHFRTNIFLFFFGQLPCSFSCSIAIDLHRCYSRPIDRIFTSFFVMSFVVNFKYSQMVVVNFRTVSGLSVFCHIATVDVQIYSRI